MDNDILYGLNENQKEAVTTTEGYVRVIAGAGSGKTKALTSRYAYIVNNLGISPSNILCVTFTNKAANEMKRRIRSMLDAGMVTDFICTYHGFCVKVLREDIYKINYPKTFIILDEEDQKGILKDVYDDLNITSSDWPYHEALKYIGCLKNAYIEKHVSVDSYIEIGDNLSLHDKVLLSYIKKQKKNFALDFNDLMSFTLYIFKHYADVLDKWQSKLHYIMVDETQDNSLGQWGFVRLLSDKHKNLFVVGDPDQAIYEWRGAKPEFLVDFAQNFTPCKTIILNENYRSTPNILDVANCIIQNNKNRVEKDLFTKAQAGSIVTHFHAKNEQEEGTWIAQTIKKKAEEGVSLKNMAVLFRANYISRSIEQELIRLEIPYIVYGGIRFFERQEIKDALAYFRMIDAGDDISFLRVINKPTRKLGKVFISNIKNRADKTGTSLFQTLVKHIADEDFNKQGAKEFISIIEQSRQALKEGMSISDLLQFVLDKSGLMKELRLDGEEERLENINELISAVIQYEKDNANEDDLSLNSYLQNIALYTNMDYKEEVDFVKLMTIHQAKGLEFPLVFVSGFSEGILPNHRSIRERKKAALEEERRLAYVAITRAERELYLTESDGFDHSSRVNKQPSRFILEIKDNLFVSEGKLNEEWKNEALTTLKQIDLALFFEPKVFVLNEKVRHPIFGIGEVVEVLDESQEYMVQFESQEHPKPISYNFRHWKNTDEPEDDVAPFIVFRRALMKDHK